MSGPEQLGEAVGLAIVRQEDGSVVLDYAGGPYIRLTPGKWTQLAAAMDTYRARGVRSGLGWPDA